MNTNILTSEGQDSLLAAIIRFPGMFDEKIRLMDYGYFTSVQGQNVCMIIKTMWQETGSLPSYSILNETVVKASQKKEMPELLLYWQKLSDIQVQEAEAHQWADIFSSAMRDGAVFAVLHKMVEALKGDPSKRKPGGATEVIKLMPLMETAAALAEPKGELDGKTLAELANNPASDDDTILGPGKRYVCRGGSFLLSAPTGAGKSAWVMGAAGAWSIGKEFCGIAPARPLRIVIIQAENDEGDLHEMSVGQYDHIGMTRKDWEMAHQNTVFIHHNQSTGDEFLMFVKRALRKHQPDLLIIDPLNAYAKGDLKSQETIAEFCRTGLNPLLTEFKCALLLVHHQNKPNHSEKDAASWRPMDWSYNFAGSADLANWARAIMVIAATAHPGVFKFVAAKRGRRLGWEQDGKRSLTRYFAHSEDPEKIVWCEPTPDQLLDMEQAEEERRRASRGSKSGRKDGYVTERILEPLESGEMLSIGDWLSALHATGCEVSQATLYRKAEQLEKKGTIVSSGSRWKMAPKSTKTIDTSRV